MESEEQNSDVILGNGHIMLSAFDASDVTITYQDNRHMIPFDMNWDIEIEKSREKKHLSEIFLFLLSKVLFLLSLSNNLPIKENEILS